MKNILKTAAIVSFAILVLFGVAKAAPNDLRISQVNSTDDGSIINFAPYPTSGAIGVMGLNGTTFKPFSITFGSGLLYSSTTLSVSGISTSSISGLATVAVTGNYNDLLGKPASASGTVSSVGVTSSDFTITGSPIATSGVITANLNASGVTAGTYDVVTVNNKGIVTSGTSSLATTTLGTVRNITTTAAQANGWQLSATKWSSFTYSVKLTSTANITSGQEGYVIAEIASTNSTNASDWKKSCDVTGNGQTYSLAVALQGVQPVYGSCSGYLSPGSFVRLREVNVIGTPTYSFDGSQETILPF